MSFRTVALDTPSRRERATRWEPTGSAVSMYSSTTARRIAALRSSRSIGPTDVISTRFYRVPGAVGRPASAHGALDHRGVARRRHSRSLLVRDRERDDGALDAKGSDSGVRAEDTGRDRPRRLCVAHEGPQLVRPIGRQWSQVVIDEEAVAVGEVDDTRA